MLIVREGVKGIPQALYNILFASCFAVAIEAMNFTFGRLRFWLRYLDALLDRHPYAVALGKIHRTMPSIVIQLTSEAVCGQISALFSFLGNRLFSN